MLVAGAVNANERISHSVNGAVETWRIDEPNVKQRVTDYPTVRFEPGDRVTVTAGGCAQTGGSGRTWKRYVDPQGPKSDHLYHGLVQIPGAVPQLARIQTVFGRTFTIPPGLDPRLSFLRLGYEDDGYGDNGYWGHDDGTGDQCKGVGPAWVIITIVRNRPTAPAVVVAAPPARLPIRLPGTSAPPATATPPAPVRPDRIAFQPDNEVIPSTLRLVPLSIRLVDEKGTPLPSITGVHRIRFKSLTDPALISFDPETLELSQAHQTGNAHLVLKGLPQDGKILITAEDQEGDLHPGEKTLTLDSRIQAVAITGVSEARFPFGQYSFELHLTDKEGIHLAADWDRKIILTANGKLVPTEVIVSNNQEHALVTYRPPWKVGLDKLTAESTLLRPAELQITVVLGAFVLVLFAAIGGMLGSLARETYKGHFKEFLPKWGTGRIALGVLGNMLFGALFGVVLFQAANLGLVATSALSKLSNQPRPVAQTITFAFFFGVLGGFGGIVVLARLLERVLPDQAKSEPKPKSTEGDS